MRLNPVLDAIGGYPFVALDEAKHAAVARGVTLIDFGVGEPREATPPFIREALVAALAPVSTYPKAVGLPELREAIAAWASRRFGAALDPETEIVPTLGSKEAVFGLAQAVGGEAVAVTTPGYPVPDRGARVAGREVLELPIAAGNDFLPDLDALSAADWRRLGLLWLNYPNNPTGATVPLAFLERAAALAREHDVLLACDEAYSELWFAGAPPASALQLADRTNVVVLNTLSKRSSMPGYRSGFLAGDPRLVGALKRFRPNVGTAPQEFVQRASVAAWGDEAHVEEVRGLYAAKREVLLPALEASGLRLAGGDATFFLWMAVADGGDDQAAALDLLQRGIVCAPGSFFGPGGAGHLRFALVPTLEECRAAAEVLSSRAARR